MSELGFFVIIAAGGAGLRFGGGVRKQYLELAGKSILEHTVSRFLKIPAAKKISVVVPESDLHLMREKYSFLNDTRIILTAGGSTRAESVHRGYLALTPLKDEDIVLIHDAARPLFSQALVERVFQAAKAFGAAVPGLEMTDTIKLVRDEICVETLPRAELKAVQTPQGFVSVWLKEAYSKIDLKSPELTDEAAILESLGRKVHVVTGEKTNIKITKADDISLSEAILQTY